MVSYLIEENDYEFDEADLDAHPDIEDDLHFRKRPIYKPKRNIQHNPQRTKK